MYTNRHQNGGTGLSPRVRGNLQGKGKAESTLGSIPASAGEPASHEGVLYFTEVYPRECGGTPLPRCPHIADTGVSPRVRGNPMLRSGLGKVHGSIPASAGEPSTPCLWRRCPAVYPRECGGTEWCTVKDYLTWGLSPRVRGNPTEATETTSHVWSIPASAGEPPRAGLPSMTRTVYPRECGGTAVASVAAVFVIGLSPRVRGNPDTRPQALQVYGSIPASAGEPTCWTGTANAGRVYPRECGGTCPAME